MIVVSDTTPVHYLLLIDQIDLLPALFGRVVVPPGVLAELRHPGSPDVVRTWSDAAPAWLEVRAPAAVDSTLRLGRGETEAISLALEVGADEVLIDDMQAPKAALACGLKVAGTLLVLDRAARQELVELAEVLRRLMQTSFRAPAELVRRLLAADAQRER